MWIWSVAALVVLGALTFTRSAAGPVHPTPQRHMIEIRGLAFHPDTVPLSVGDTIVWINHDIFPHTATEREKRWDTGTIAPDSTSRPIVLTDRNAFSYYCMLHPNMTGVVLVK